MGTNECLQPASKSSWDNQDFGDISMVLKMAHFRKSTGPQWVKYHTRSKCRAFSELLLAKYNIKRLSLSPSLSLSLSIYLYLYIYLYLSLYINILGVFYKTDVTWRASQLC